MTDRIYTNDLPVTTHAPQPAPFRNNNTAKAEMVRHRRILNCSDREIIIIERSGLRTTLPRNHEYIHGHYRNAERRLEVDFSDTYDYYVKTDVPESSVGNQTPAGLLKDMIVRATAGPQVADYYYSISFDEIAALGGVIYDHTLDMVISLVPLDDSFTHPHAVEDVVNYFYDHVERSKEDTHFRMFYVDRFNRYGRLFSIFGAEPFEIPCLEEPNLADGVHMFTNGWNANCSGLRRTPNAVPHLHWSFEELEKEKAPIRIYSSYALAKAHGSPEAVFEQNKLEIKRDILNRELARDEIQAERKLIEQRVQGTGKTFETVAKIVTAAIGLATVILTFKKKLGGGKDG